MDFLSIIGNSNTFIDIAVEKIGSVNLNWVGKMISWLFDAFSGVYGGVIIGVILFTLVLKTVVLPLDAYSRVKTKKQSLIMEEMRPQMEKLQKQYANDKNMYSQKVMELQKKNGYSPLSACLPMIVSLVIFFIVIGAFSTYSNYAIINTYNNMVDVYNASVEVYVIKGEDDPDVSHFLIEEDGNYKVNFDKFVDYYAGVNNYTEEKKAEYITEFTAKNEAAKKVEVSSYVQQNAARAAAKYYRENSKDIKFAWIGNVWYPDSMLNKVVPNYDKFKSSITRASSGSASDYEEYYNKVTYYLSHEDPENPDAKLETKTYNGYFVLIALAIGLMFLQQFIMTRSQKASNELSSVDGSAAKTNKYMMIMMPIMYGVFSFFYSAAFSMYMIISSCYGLLSTVVINKIVEVRFAKNDGNDRGGRVNNRKRLK